MAFNVINPANGESIMEYAEWNATQLEDALAQAAAARANGWPSWPESGQTGANAPNE